MTATPVTPTATHGRPRLIDCSLRDGHQSLLATRMSTEQCLRVLPMLRDSGYRIIELWGGATLDSALRFTGDNPWDRLEQFRRVLDEAGHSGIEIRSLCRGQNLFGYNPYPDNLVCEFLKEAVRTANPHRMRVFDALNDPRNLITAVMATKTFDGIAEAALSYTTSPVHDADYFLRFARKAMDNGADALAIKDMAGLLHPHDAFTLIETLKTEFPNTELTLHAHCTNGLAVASYVVGLLTGVDFFDTCYGPMAGGTAQPPAEFIKLFADELGIDLGIDFASAPQIDAELRKIREELHTVDKDPKHFGGPWPSPPEVSQELRDKVKKSLELIQSRDREKIEQAMRLIEDDIMVSFGYPPVDRAQLESQIPGGMISNLHNQLKEQGKLDDMPQILEEVPRVRAQAGYVPLVTPTSQIVGTQAAFNVMQGKPYGFVSEPFREMMMGKYGRLPGTPDAEVLQTVSRGEACYTGRPADYVKDIDLEKAYADHGDLIQSERDLLLLLLFPMPAKQFLTKQREAAGATA